MSSTNSYPPPPWRLHGRAVLALRAVRIRHVEQLVPRAMDIQAIAPGTTLAVLALIDYQRESTLAYHELIIAPALVRAGIRVGAWISHIYVDSETSMAGGRAIWGLPKQLATFTWTEGARTTINARCVDSQVDCEIHDAPIPASTLRLPLLAPAFGMDDTHSKWLLARGSGRLMRARGSIQCAVPGLEALGFDRITRLWRIESFDLVFPSPKLRPVNQTAT